MKCKEEQLVYINREINWLKYCKKKRVYIFGAGKNGEKLFHQFQDEAGIKISGVIDNNRKVVEQCINGQSWFNKVYTFDEYKRLREKDDIIVISTAISEIEKQLLEEEIFPFIDYTQIDFPGVDGSGRYNAEYFSMQLDYAKVDSVLDYSFFQNFIKPTDRVAEFGMGGGLLLDKLNCREKIGIEVNDVAREYARGLGIASVSDIAELKDNNYDVIISTHALEHCFKPYEILCELREKLVDGGKAIFVVPYDSIRTDYGRGADCYHLYTWNQRDIGNLFKVSGFFVKEVGLKEVAWPREWKKMFSEETVDWFNAISVLESERVGYYSVYVVAEK